VRVLFAIHTPRDSHSAVYLDYSQLSAYLAGRGHRASIVSPWSFAWLRSRDARLFPILYPWVLMRCLARYRHRYDLVVFHSYAGWAYHLNSRRGGPPTITSFHGLEPLFYRALHSGAAERAGMRASFRLLHGVIMPMLIRLSCRRSTRVTCLNSEEAAFLKRHGWAEPHRVEVVANGVPASFFTTRHSYAEPPTRLLFVGQWLRRKGIVQLAEAFSLLAREQPDLELHCVGTLADPETVRNTFEPDIRQRVIVRSRVAREDLPAVYGDAHLFVLPTFFEGFSVALLEAMASGLPIVTTPVGATPDLLRHEASALIVPTGDGRAVADAIRRLLDDAGLRRRLGEAAAHAARPYPYERVHAHALALYEEILARSRARGAE
jgi:glycosyltransferase involved in cell wall biosynthesis